MNAWSIKCIARKLFELIDAQNRKNELGKFLVVIFNQQSASTWALKLDEILTTTSLLAQICQLSLQGKNTKLVDQLKERLKELLQCFVFRRCNLEMKERW